MQPVLSHKSLGWEVHSLIPTLFTIWLSSFVQLVVLRQSVLDFTSFGFQCLSLLHDSVFPLSSFFILISFFFLNGLHWSLHMLSFASSVFIMQFLFTSQSCPYTISSQYLEEHIIISFCCTFLPFPIEIAEVYQLFK